MEEGEEGVRREKTEMRVKKEGEREWRNRRGMREGTKVRRGW